jgi:hypothetical protein
MVHALEEVKRVLRSNGVMIDLRPITEDWHVQIASAREKRSVGTVEAHPEDQESDRQANAAVEKAAGDRWFQRRGEDLFNYNYYWDSPVEMQEYVEEEWSDWVDVSPEVWANVRAAWAVADADARLLVETKMLITRWQRLD